MHASARTCDASKLSLSTPNVEKLKKLSKEGGSDDPGFTKAASGGLRDAKGGKRLRDAFKASTSRALELQAFKLGKLSDW